MIHMKGFILAGTSSNVGKTTITMGVLKALKNRGYAIQAFKSGPDYIDTMFHSFITDKKSVNLDLFLMKPDGVKYAFYNNGKSKLSIIEGVMGLYDGVLSKGKEISSTALLAKTLDVPVVLIIDGSGTSTSAAATVLGFDQFDPKVKLIGVIVNKVSSEGHYKLIKRAIEKNTEVACLGYLKKNKAFNLESQHLGLIPADELEALDEKIKTLAREIEKSVDLELLVSKSTYTLNKCQTIKATKSKQPLKLGLAKDAAFNFYYEENIELLRACGVEIIEFSPMTDDHIPNNLNGLYLGGGFPEKFAKKLSENQTMIESIRAFVDTGGMIYGECGGLMYLTNEIIDFEDKKFPMCGIIDCSVQMTSRLQHFGYVYGQYDDIKFRGHEFHRSKVIKDNNVKKAYKLSKLSNPSQNWLGGYVYKNVIAGYAHIHFYSSLEFLERLIDKMTKREV